MKNMASSRGDEAFELFSEQARQTFLIFPTVSVSVRKNISPIIKLVIKKEITIAMN